MSEYISFSSIDPYSDEFKELSPETQEAVQFFHGLDWEGGIDGLYGYGGVDSFPTEVQEYAAAYGKAYEDLKEIITAWGKARGVVY